MPDESQSAAPRIRKAWQVRVKGYDHVGTVFAATAGKARVKIWRCLDDGHTRIVDVYARRATWCDVKLPAPDPVSEMLNNEQRHCLLHAFGATCGDVTKAGYRDYFYTRRDDPPLVALTEHGLMKPMAGDKWGDGMTYFVLTAAGRHVALSLTPEYNR